MLRPRPDGVPAVVVPDGRMARLHHRLRHRLPMWVIYWPITREYPGSWVARMHVTLPEPKPTRFVVTHDSLPELRSILPPGLVCMGRHVDDMPEIQEIWL
jgi:hypothetical protein